MRSVAIGVDFGTESARALIVDIRTGEELAEAVCDYPHGVIDTVLPDSNLHLPPAWALQDPGDYLPTLVSVVTEALRFARVRPEEVVGLGVDTTACTVIPTTADLVPLRQVAGFEHEPHAYAKLWKHHAAQSCADRINVLARRHGGLFLDAYGGKISSEWLIPKALQIFDEAPEVFAAAERIIELEDWLVSRLVGHEVRGAHVAGYKATYRVEGDGYPSPEFLDELSPGFSRVLQKLGHTFLSPGQHAGGLTAQWAERLGLRTGVPVAVGNMDAHVALLGCGVSSTGVMVLVMGTSVCNLVLAEDKRDVEGMSGVVRDGIVPGLWAYEAGQPGVGDTLGWYVRNFVPEPYAQAARAQGLSTFDLLARGAGALAPGESGLMALDWFNGNRSVLVDANLSGLLVGMTLATRPEHVYRALLEAAAFGQRMILDAFTSSGVPVESIVVCGGLPSKSPLLMQILADVTGREIQVSASRNTPALGAALHAAIAAGEERGGFGSFAEASALGRVGPVVYRPDPSTRRTYDELYDIYVRMHDSFGRSPDEVMHRLRRIATRSSTRSPGTAPLHDTPAQPQPVEGITL